MADKLAGRAQRSGNGGEGITLDPVFAEAENGREVGAWAERPAWKRSYAQSEALGSRSQNLLADDFTATRGDDNFT